MMITGTNELRMEPLTAVVYLRPVYEVRLQKVVPSTPSASMIRHDRRIAGQPRTRCGQANGSSSTLAHHPAPERERVGRHVVPQRPPGDPVQRPEQDRGCEQQVG